MKSVLIIFSFWYGMITSSMPYSPPVTTPQPKKGTDIGVIIPQIPHLEPIQQTNIQPVSELPIIKVPKAQPPPSPQPGLPSTNGCGVLKDKLSRLGITGAELDAAITLSTRESSCNSAAVNVSSGACGEFQSLPCGKWGTPGTDGYLNNAIAYVRNRYGGFGGALNHSLAYNWY